jgi:hypothetical protein
MNASTHKYRLLKKLYDTELKLTATDFSYVSNANQFFVELENQGLITSEWSKKGKAKVKLRFVDVDQRIKAKKYLDNMDMNPNQDGL